MKQNMQILPNHYLELLCNPAKTYSTMTLHSLLFNWFFFTKYMNFPYVPVTPAECPFSIHMTVAGGGMTWHIDRVPSRDEHATRDLSSLANFTLETTIKLKTMRNVYVIYIWKQEIFVELSSQGGNKFHYGKNFNVIDFDFAHPRGRWCKWWGVSNS